MLVADDVDWLASLLLRIFSFRPRPKSLIEFIVDADRAARASARSALLRRSPRLPLFVFQLVESAQGRGRADEGAAGKTQEIALKRSPEIEGGGANQGTKGPQNRVGVRPSPEPTRLTHWRGEP